MKIKIGNNQKLTALLLAGIITLSTVSITGCTLDYQEQEEQQTEEVTEKPVEDYDIVDGDDIEKAFTKQVISIPEEDFKLVIEYSLEPENSTEWRTTANKKIYTKVYTEGLSSPKKVYVDNIHTETTIISTYEEMNNIIQDSTDTKINNNLMLGFPISDTTNFYYINEIDGQNTEFVLGSLLGYNALVNGTEETRRLTETEYLKNGVYANKISSIYRLLIQKDKEEPYSIEVLSEVLVPVTNTIVKESISGKERTYVYNRNGIRTELNNN